MSERVYDLTGRTFQGKVRVVIRPGFGVRLPAPEQPSDEKEPRFFRHYGYEDGAVDVPVAIASDMLHDGRAFVADEDDQPVDADGVSVNTTAVQDAVDSVNAASPAEAA